MDRSNSSEAKHLCSSSEVHPTEEPKSRFALSSSATPFIPSFILRQAPAPVQSPTPVGIDATSTPPPRKGNRKKRLTCRERKPNASPSEVETHWVSLLQGMSLEELDALMRCMPPEVQQCYAQCLGRETPRHSKGGRGAGRRGVRGSSSAKTELTIATALVAAITTLSQLPQEHLKVLEELLWEMEAEDAVAAGLLNEREAGIYMEDDADLQQEEEEWLIEQILEAEPSRCANDDAVHEKEPEKF